MAIISCITSLSIDNCTKMQVLSDKYTLRFAVGAPLTEERHIVAAWKILQDEATTLLRTVQSMPIL